MIKHQDLVRGLVLVLLSALLELSGGTHAQEVRVAAGVNRPAIAWLKTDAEWRGTVDAMAQNGVTAMRMMLVTPFAQSMDVVAYCNQKGIDVLLMVPLTLRDYYPPGMVPRKGNSGLYTVPHLSELDPARFREKWSEALGLMTARGLRISGVQIDNEFNSAAFNGDLPLVKGGAILRSGSETGYAFWGAYRMGMERVVEVLSIVSTSLKASERYKEVPVVLGGLARPTDTWIRNIGGSLVEPDLALRTLLALGAGRHIDAYAIHVYPQVPRAQWSKPEVVIRDYFEKRMAELTTVTGTAKRWWITEWGFARRREDTQRCDGPDPRLPLFLAFADIMRQEKWRALIGPSFIYDWDESSNFRIWDGQAVLCRTSFF